MTIKRWLTAVVLTFSVIVVAMCGRNLSLAYVSAAAPGTGEVSHSIALVQARAGETGQVAGEVAHAARDRSVGAADLRRELDGFLAGIRAA